MSYIVQIVVMCDAPQCGEMFTLRHHNEGGLSKTFAGNIAASRGWKVPSGKTGSADPKRARCPKHA